MKDHPPTRRWKWFKIAMSHVVLMDAQQAINLAIFDRFEKEGIDFAYPTQARVQRKA